MIAESQLPQLVQLLDLQILAYRDLADGLMSALKAQTSGAKIAALIEADKAMKKIKELEDVLTQLRQC